MRSGAFGIFRWSTLIVERDSGARASTEYWRWCVCTSNVYSAVRLHGEHGSAQEGAAPRTSSSRDQDETVLSTHQDFPLELCDIFTRFCRLGALLLLVDYV